MFYNLLKADKSINSVRSKYNCTKKTFDKNEHNKGFTLLEVLVAVSLMSIGLLAVLAMQSVAMNANTIASDLSAASSLSQQVMEDIVSWSPRDPRFKTTTSTPQAYNRFPNPANNSLHDQSSVTISGVGIFTATYNTTVGGGTSGIPIGVTKIDITVTGRTHTVNITSFKRTV